MQRTPVMVVSGFRFRLVLRKPPIPYQSHNHTAGGCRGCHGMMASGLWSGCWVGRWPRSSPHTGPTVQRPCRQPAPPKTLLLRSPTRQSAAPQHLRAAVERGPPAVRHTLGSPATTPRCSKSRPTGVRGAGAHHRVKESIRGIRGQQGFEARPQEACP